MKRSVIYILLPICLLAMAPMAATGGPFGAGQGISTTCDDLLGSWIRQSDKCVIGIKKTPDGGYEVSLVEIGGLATYGFSVGEITGRFKCAKAGQYEGQSKWRFTDGRSEWRNDTLALGGDKLTGAAGEFVRLRRSGGCDDLLGSWIRLSDKCVIGIKKTPDGGYDVSLVEIGGLATYGFSVGEITGRFKCVKAGQYEGQSKWRFTDGRSEWRNDTLALGGDKLTGAAGEFVRRYRP